MKIYIYFNENLNRLCIWNLSSRKRMILLSYISYTIAANALAAQRDVASVTLILVYIARRGQVSGRGGGHDDVIKWKHFPRYWPIVRGIHRSSVNSPHKGQWRGALVFSLICAWINGWVNNRKAGDFRHHRSHYDVTIMGSGWRRQSNLPCRWLWTNEISVICWCTGHNCYVT